MKKVGAIIGCMFLAIVGLTAVAGDVESGLKVGDAPAAFTVKDITGPSKGTSLCYRCKYGARPVVSVFAREINDEVAKLIKEVDETVAKNNDKKMAAFVVVLAEDVEKVAPKLEELAKKNGIKNVPLTVFDSASGPDEYKIAKNADVTVMMWNKSSVKANTAFAKGELNDKAISSIIQDTSKILN